jgi:ABC-2 type transport system ATP-binding protein
MVHDPPILVLDEPTAGVDVELRRQLWDQVREMNRRGVTILLTTHYLEEAEELCDRIAIINHGRVIAIDTKDDMMRRLDNKELVLSLDRDLAALPPALAQFHAELTAPRRIVFRYRASESPVAGILRTVAALGLGVVDISTTETDLEDIFLQLTREPRDAAG